MAPAIARVACSAVATLLAYSSSMCTEANTVRPTDEGAAPQGATLQFNGGALSYKLPTQLSHWVYIPDSRDDSTQLAVLFWWSCAYGAYEAF